jgi:hypothetical protein
MHLFSQDNKGKQIKRETLRNMVTDGIALIIWLFHELVDKPTELKAASKFCFIVAAEEKEQGFGEHYIPHNAGFEHVLRQACERIKAAVRMDPGKGLYEFDDELQELASVVTGWDFPKAAGRALLETRRSMLNIPA